MHLRRDALVFVSFLSIRKERRFRRLTECVCLCAFLFYSFVLVVFFGFFCISSTFCTRIASYANTTHKFSTCIKMSEIFSHSKMVAFWLAPPLILITFALWHRQTQHQISTQIHRMNSHRRYAHISYDVRACVLCTQSFYFRMFRFFFCFVSSETASTVEYLKINWMQCWR